MFAVVQITCSPHKISKVASKRSVSEKSMENEITEKSSEKSLPLIATCCRVVSLCMEYVFDSSSTVLSEYHSKKLAINYYIIDKQ